MAAGGVEDHGLQRRLRISLGGRYPLHDGLEDFTAGVNDSKFARWLMRHYQKKGIEMECEADNAETFAANFSDRDDIVFPRIHRTLSGRDAPPSTSSIC